MRNAFRFTERSVLQKVVGVLCLRCPQCGAAEIFHHYFDTPGRCPSCGYYFMRESGYFLPHVVIGYLAATAAGLGAWPILYFATGLRSPAWTLSIMVAVSLGFCIWSLRYAKMAWIVMDLYLHPPCKEDFEARGREAGPS
jgi:uncharacterized protein (DUF983 family)